MSTTSAFTFEDVSFSHPGNGPCLAQARLTIPEGAFALVGGPSGAGKSTLLRLMNRLLEPDSGRILYRGRPLAEYDPPRLRREVATVGQEPTLVSGTVRDNLLLPYTFRVNADLVRPGDDTLEAWLARLLLDGVTLSSRASALSVGQRQRLCLIRTLLPAPRVLLMDEPTSALDAESREVVERAAEDLCADDGVTVVMVSHVEMRFSRVSPMRLHLAAGRLEVSA
ncbi:putative ABC transport system ATP-binding protein [Desulfobaculum xiamenense]|uniref:Putative ABC transport system ATP-binding protein n=1 Tax=Desulfobaculum xiamenense TaxID=995050 RepID=A0A846QHK3_9BACT|nr:ABC transporter ATP-binding protein [Desulfobaculum xiamenense]NJB68316.1 putative ABC transport system ATP-binding protein [Desulfobaculum xiamenense]